MFEIRHIAETTSTNEWIKGSGKPTYSLGEGGGFVVWADYQTAGRGQGTNTWESERGKNLTFSMMIRPRQVAASEQFILSMAHALVLKKALDAYPQPLPKRKGVFSIKWPNDIYWNDRKISGTLIENRLQGSYISECIIGTGINVNQQRFVSDAPNPVSLRQIVGEDVDREELLHTILELWSEMMDTWNPEEIRKSYRQQMYRGEGWFEYSDKDGPFTARLVSVEDDGHLVLCDTNGRERRYGFKEVTFLIDNSLQAKRHSRAEN